MLQIDYICRILANIRSESFVFPSLLYNLNINIYKAVILPIFCISVKLGLTH